MSSGDWWSAACFWTSGGVRITGSIFVTMMAGGAALVAYALTSGLPPKTSLTIAYIGCMFFGLGSEIAGVAVTRSIAKWFKDGNMAFAMGLQLAIARLGTAFALVISPKLVAEKGVVETYSLMETASPAFLGLILMLVGMVLWAIFVAMDARFDRQAGLKDTVETAEEDKFRFSDVVKLLKNKHFIVIALLCVFFYSSVVSFKKFASSILIPRFDVPVEAPAGWFRCFRSPRLSSLRFSDCWWTRSVTAPAGCSPEPCWLLSRI